VKLGILYRAAIVLPLLILGGGSVEAGATARANPSLIGIRLLDVPADLSSDPRAKLYIIDHLAPRAVIHRRVEVSSTGAAPTTVEVYAGAASIVGGSFIGAVAPDQNELSGWISLDQSAVALQPEGNATVDVTIAVPSRASSGERYAVIWASVSSPPAAPGGVLLVNRVGIRVYLDVGPGGDPPSDFQIDNIAGARTVDGRPEVIARVHNTGLRALDIRGDLQLSEGPGSLSAGPFPVTTGSTLAPGDTVPIVVVLDRQLPGGPWTVRLALVSGLLQRSATATIRFPASPGTENPPVTPDAIAWSLILGIGGFVVITVLLALCIALRHRRLTPAVPPGTAELGSSARVARGEQAREHPQDQAARSAR
jgi:hypothetical protein